MVNSIMKIVFCNHMKHPLEFVRNITGGEIEVSGGKRSVWMCPDCGKLIMMNEPFIQGEVSDGHHTFNELYHHRAMLFATICNQNPDIAWKSKRHNDPYERMPNGMFIVGINTPEGQATYHYNIDPYWDMFKVKELTIAPEWDGHTSSQAIERIYSLSKNTKPWKDEEKISVKHAHWINDDYDFICSLCRETNDCETDYCPNCGAIMDEERNK